MRATLDTFGQIDILVNNAGIAGVIKLTLDYPEEVFDRVMAVNTRSVFLGMQHAGRAMKDKGNLAPHKIRVNAVCPAPTATDMMFNLEKTQSPDDPEAARQRFFASIPLGRYGEPAEIAAAVAFLAGSQASFITGSALTVDGGVLAS
jgi:NAD(P)-dependent dehydrogenase (short-subunit alcohol dehydrogenase family)